VGAADSCSAEFPLGFWGHVIMVSGARGAVGLWASGWRGALLGGAGKERIPSAEATIANAKISERELYALVLPPRSATAGALVNGSQSKQVLHQVHSPGCGARTRNPALETCAPVGRSSRAIRSVLSQAPERRHASLKSDLDERNRFLR
jgi:hypothetical protein